jgi:hypothetical protein
LLSIHFTHRGALVEGINFIQKPFSTEAWPSKSEGHWIYDLLSVILQNTQTINDNFGKNNSVIISTLRRINWQASK